MRKSLKDIKIRKLKKELWKLKFKQELLQPKLHTILFTRKKLFEDIPIDQHIKLKKIQKEIFDLTVKINRLEIQYISEDIIKKTLEDGDYTLTHPFFYQAELAILNLLSLEIFKKGKVTKRNFYKRMNNFFLNFDIKEIKQLANLYEETFIYNLNDNDLAKICISVSNRVHKLNSQ